MIFFSSYLSHTHTCFFFVFVFVFFIPHFSEFYILYFSFQAGEFNRVNSAFKALDFSDNASESIWKMIAVILHLGNIEFDSREDNGESIATIRSNNEVQTIANLLQVKVEDVKQSLLTRVIAAMGEVRI